MTLSENIEELVSEIEWESWLNAQSQFAIESSKWGLLRLGDPGSTRYDIIM
jgi:23S rRNA G2445 N2-methylase RlmL